MSKKVRKIKVRKETVIPETAPLPGTFYRAKTSRKTRRQIKDVVVQDNVLYVKYLAMEGMFEGKTRKVRYDSFMKNNAIETEEDKGFHGWHEKRHVSKWKLDKLDWIERFGFNPGWDLGED